MKQAALGGAGVPITGRAVLRNPNVCGSRDSDNRWGFN